MADFMEGLQRAFGPTGDAAGDLVARIKAALGSEGAQDTFEAGGIEMGPEDVKQGVMPLDPSGALGRSLQAANRGGEGIQGVARLLKGRREIPSAGVREGFAHDQFGFSREAGQRLEDYRFFNSKKGGKLEDIVVNPEDANAIPDRLDASEAGDFIFTIDREGRLVPQSGGRPTVKQLDSIMEARERAVKQFAQIDEANLRIMKRELPEEFALLPDDDKLSLFEQLGMEDLGKKADELRKKNLKK